MFYISDISCSQNTINRTFFSCFINFSNLSQCVLKHRTHKTVAAVRCSATGPGLGGAGLWFGTTGKLGGAWHRCMGGYGVGWSWCNVPKSDTPLKATHPLTKSQRQNFPFQTINDVTQHHTHPCTDAMHRCHAPFSLPVVPNHNPAPPNPGPVALHHTAALL